MGKSKVYFCREITEDKVVEMFKVLRYNLPGKVAVKVPSGEKGNQNYLKPEFLNKIIDYVNGTVVECNTAYEGSRNILGSNIMNLYEVLNNLNIEYKQVEHEPVYTVSEAKKVDMSLKGVGCKNLFLIDKKEYYLVILEENKKANLKEIGKLVGKTHLSFVREKELYDILGLIPGSVSPFGIINDKENKVTLIIDKELKNKRLLFHPNTNTKTVSIEYTDLIKFIEFENHNYIFF